MIKPTGMCHSTLVWQLCLHLLYFYLQGITFINMLKLCLALYLSTFQSLEIVYAIVNNGLK